MKSFKLLGMRRKTYVKDIRKKLSCILPYFLLVYFICVKKLNNLFTVGL
jgi:hypothetical protein